MTQPRAPRRPLPLYESEALAIADLRESPSPDPRPDQQPDPLPHRPGPRGRLTPGRPGSPDGAPAGRRTGLMLTWAAALAATAVVTVVHLRGMYVAPVRFDDEGTYVSQAQAILQQGRLSPYTYWYDHPPLGWIVLAGWLGLPDVTAHAPNLIAAGRQLMLLLDALTALLTFALTRRVGGSRAAAAAAALLVGLSPLALTYHRMVLLDNIAVPLLLGAFVLTLSPRRRLVAALAAGLALAAAVLVKETTLLLAPFVVWSLWRHADRETRRMCLAVFTIGAVLPLAIYPLFALVKGELLPGPGHVSLLDGVLFQLHGRTPSGNVLTAGSDARRVVEGWFTQDPYLVPAGVLAAVLAVVAPVRRLGPLRPVAAALVFSALVPLRGGYLPVPYVVALLPLAAVALAGGLDVVVRALAARGAGLLGPSRAGRGRLTQGLSALTLAVALLALWQGASLVAPHWYYRDLAAQRVDFDLPYRQSSAYLEAHVPRTATLVVDNVTWTDLHDHGYAQPRLVWFTKLDADPSVQRTVNDPGDVDYVVSTQIMRTSRDAGPLLRELLDHSQVVRSWGSGAQRIDLLRVDR
jgi:4-amino-4-deoxy-L-arabinose transferase-like glycosyltransferase